MSANDDYSKRQAVPTATLAGSIVVGLLGWGLITVCAWGLWLLLVR